MRTTQEKDLGRRRRDRSPNRRTTDRKFHFVVSPTTTYGVDVDVLVRLGGLVASLSQKEGFEKELAGIVLFPIVANADLYSQNDFVTHKRSDRAFYVGKNIDYETWVRARSRTRLRMAVNNFEASIKAIPEKHFTAQAKARLVAILHAASEQIT